jgi:hypothetical protein
MGRVALSGRSSETNSTSEIGEGEGALEEATTATPVLALCRVEMSYLTSRRP